MGHPTSKCSARSISVSSMSGRSGCRSLAPLISGRGTLMRLGLRGEREGAICVFVLYFIINLINGFFYITYTNIRFCYFQSFVIEDLRMRFLGFYNFLFASVPLSTDITFSFSALDLLSSHFSYNCYSILCAYYLLRDFYLSFLLNVNIFLTNPLEF